MGQKINPVIFRITGGQTRWLCDWYARDKAVYERNIFEDIVILKYLRRCAVSQYIGDVLIERKSTTPHITIKTGKQVAIFGKKGVFLEKMQKDIQNLIDKRPSISVSDIKKPDLVARVLGNNVANQVVKRVSYKRAVKGAIEAAMKAGALGVKVSIAGRLNGAEIARSETFKEGSMPLHTIRANINYAVVEAFSIYGVIGIKVWVHSNARMN
ncbi:MAG: 30S ribosomal protein S3 [Alphaproteobacteria bacterium]|nr:30S ribosomal protein S3 [Rickettsiales bacterium]